MDWFDLLAVQGTLKSLLQHHSWKASILWCSAFLRVQLSHPYMTTEKTITLTIQTFVGKMMSPLFNILFRFVIAFLPRSKCLFISWLQSPSTVILKPKKTNKICHYFHFSPSICREVMGQMPCSQFLNAEFPEFSLSSFTPIQRLFSSSSLSAIRVVSICMFVVADISPSNPESSLCQIHFFTIVGMRPLFL